MNPDVDMVMDSKSEAERIKDLGNKAFRESNYHSAIDYYTQAIKLCPDEPTYYNNRATASFQLNRFQNSIDDSKLAISKDPSNIKAHIRAAKCYTRFGKLNLAREYYQKAIALDPQQNNPIFKDLRLIDELEGYARKAKSLISESNDFQMAGIFLDKIMSECYKSVEFRVLKIRVLLGKKEALEASNLAGEILRENEDNPEVIYLRGKSHYLSGNFESAIKHYIRALQMEPDLPNAGPELKKVKLMEAKKKEGNEAFSAKRYEDAYNTYSDLLEIDPLNDTFNSTIFCNRAAAAMQIGKYKEAAEDCSRSIDLNESYVRAYKRRANIYMKLEKYQEAINDYERYKELDPSDTEIKGLLKDAQLELKKSKRKDYYKILGVEKDADERVIKRAYKLAAMKWHPDKNSENKEEAERQFKEVGEAYGVLSDPQKKQRYDSGVDLEDLGGAGVDVNDIFSQFFGGGGGGGGGGFGGHQGGFSFGGFPAQGGFSTSFNGSGGGRHRHGGFPF